MKAPPTPRAVAFRSFIASASACGPTSGCARPAMEHASSRRACSVSEAVRSAQGQPHRRFNPLRGEWVLVSPQRTSRPWQGQIEAVAPEHVPQFDPGCYLCPGNDRAGGLKNPAYTSTFAFDNDFPALTPSAPPAPPAPVEPVAPVAPSAPIAPLLKSAPERG